MVQPSECMQNKLHIAAGPTNDDRYHVTAIGQAAGILYILFSKF
jgi:hypothetical protein